MFCVPWNNLHWFQMAIEKFEHKLYTLKETQILKLRFVFFFKFKFANFWAYVRYTHIINLYPDSEALLTVLGNSFCNINWVIHQIPLQSYTWTALHMQVHTNTHSHTSPFPVPSIATQWHCNCARYSWLWVGLSCESDLYLLRAVKPYLRHTKGNCQFIRVTWQV